MNVQAKPQISCALLMVGHGNRAAHRFAWDNDAKATAQGSAVELRENELPRVAVKTNFR